MECSIEDCSKPIRTAHWCVMHYTRWKRHGDPLFRKQQWGDPAARFWEKVNKTEGCWLWTGSTDGTYGQLRVDGRPGRLVPAHRFAYELLVGPIRDGLQLDHLCRVPLCVNTAHLEPVTARVNNLRGFSSAAQHARQTHCRKGHEFTSENTYVNPQGARRCKTCRTAFWQTYRRP